ncbi:Di-copper centre-containing protein, partial [Stipitochalara longipes BDJ]
CKKPVTRHEWREQTPEEMANYVSAVRCLSTKPSRLHPNDNDTLYDDFAFVHVRLGPKFHEGVIFLAWHRYFVHIYETALKTECGLKHSIPYWDWTRDWRDPNKAPVFDAEAGFGGDGDLTRKSAAGDGYCVTSSPLAGVELKYYGLDISPHCFSRSFADGGFPPKAGQLSGQKYRPEAMEGLMQKKSSSSFASTLDSIHTAIPIGLGGEMAKFTSPYEPIFFLHHTQVDRIWWEWQQSHAETELVEVGAQSNEPLEMFGFEENLSLLDMMETESPHLCYKY